MGTFIIHRKGWSAAERAVRVTFPDGFYLRVDPQEMLFNATGRRVDRMYSIINLAAGMHRSGHRVLIDDRRKDKLARCWEFVPDRSKSVFYIYFFIGYALGAGKWWDIETNLKQRVLEPHRFQLLERVAIASYYETEWNHLSFNALNILL